MIERNVVTMRIQCTVKTGPNNHHANFLDRIITCKRSQKELHNDHVLRATETENCLKKNNFDINMTTNN